jgi:hypothetical protein
MPRPPPQHATHPSQVVLAGLNILLPLISTQLLKFPKIPRLYFNLLAYMLENYAEQVVYGCSISNQRPAVKQSWPVPAEHLHHPRCCLER